MRRASCSADTTDLTAGDEEPAITTDMGTADMEVGWPQLDTVMETGGVVTESVGQY